jgi:hypothetical protein
MSKRIEEIKNRNDTVSSLCSFDGFYHVSESDFVYLLRVAEMAIMTRNMLKACIGRPVDDTATIFLDKVLEDNRE